MKIAVEEHALCLVTQNSVRFLRPTLAWDGRSSFKGVELKWFKRTEFHTSQCVWKFWALPFVTFSIVTRL